VATSRQTAAAAFRRRRKIASPTPFTTKEIITSQPKKSSQMNTQEVIETATTLVAEDKGLLAMVGSRS
jgi:hypothetical protein